MFIRSFSTVTFILILSAKIFSQSVEGHWYGTGNVKVNTVTNNYLTELILYQKGNKVTGSFNYYFRDSLFKQYIEGLYNSQSNSLSLKLTPIVFHRSVYTSIAVECNMYGSFQLVQSKLSAQLKGSFISEESHKYTCPPINFILTKSNDTTNIVRQELVEEDTLPKIIVEKSQLEERKINLVKTVEVVNDNVNLAFYDNGAIDHDTVTIFVDKKIIVSKEMLSLKAINIPVKFSNEKKFVDVSMYAVNMGDEPPNTAILIVTDGRFRYEVPLSSDYNTTATVRIQKKK